MKQRFTKLLAAVALLMLISIPTGVWGQETTYTFTAKNWSDATNSWRSDKEGTQIGDDRGVAVQKAESGAGATTKASINNISALSINAAKSSKGVGSITVKVGNTTVLTQSSFTTSSADYNATISEPLSGEVSFVVTCTTSTIYVKSVTITTSNGGSGSDTYTVTIADGITGGTVSATPTSQEAGGLVTLTATPNDAYTFTNEASNWSVIDTNNQTVTVTPGESNTATFTMPESDVTVSATFTAKPTYAITVDENIQHGSVTADPTSAYQGQTVTLTVTPSTGYAMSTLTATYNDGQDHELEITNNSFTMPAYPVTVSATFEESNDVTFDFSEIDGFDDWNTSYSEHIVEYDEAIVTFASANHSNTTITDIPVTKGGDVTIVMKNNAELTGTSFVCRQWTNKTQTITLWYSSDSGENYTSTNITSTNFSISSSNLPIGTNAVKITFSSSSNQVGIESATVTLAGTPHNVTCSTDGNGTLVANPNPASANQTVRLTATPNDGYALLTLTAYKTGDPSTTVSIVDDQFIMPDYDVTVSATFAATYTLTYSVNGVASTESYVQGSTITLPTPSQNIPYGFGFIGWTSDPFNVNSILPASYQVSSDATLYAVFAKMNIVTLTKDSGFKENGSYDTDETEYELEGITFGVNKVMQSQSGTIQFKSSGDGYIYNKDEFSNLVSIVATQAGTHRDVTLKVGNSSNPTEGTTIDPVSNGNVDTYNLSGRNYGYILLTNTSTNAVYYSSIALVFSNPNAAHCTRVYTQDITGYNNSQYGYTLIACPIDGVNPENVAGMTDGNFDLYRFNESADKEWENWKQDGNHYHFNLERGKGYLYAHKTDVTLAFAGTPVPNADFEVELSNSGTEYKGMNLVGNPFGQRAYVTVPFFVMNDEGSGFEAANRNYIEPMEGIIVDAANGTNLIFTTEAPSNGGGSKVALNLSRNRGDVIDRAIVRFGEGSQLHKFQLRENSTKVYFTEGNQDFAVVRSQKAQGEMPVNFKAEENGTYTLSVNTEEMELNYLHLIDNMTGMDVDLLQTPSYTFDATTDDYASRFRLVFSANNVDGPSTGSGTFAFYSNGNWVVNNEGEATLQVIDVNGRIVSNETINGTVATSINATPGVYMLCLVNGNEVKTQKIVVK